MRLARSTHAFDHVELDDELGATQRLTRADFERLPIDRRVRAILGRRLRFFRGDVEISVREALDDER